MLNTFREFFAGRSEGLGLKEYDVEDVIKPAVVLDGQLAYEQDPRLALIEAANRTAFRRNNLYFPCSTMSATITPESLDTFHEQTAQRALKQQEYSLLLSVNDSKVIERSELLDVISNAGIPILEGSIKKSDNENFFFNEGKEIRIESNNSNSTEFLLNFPIRFGGFAQKYSHVSSIFESLLKKRFPTASVSVTSDTSLLSIYFKFQADQSASEIKNQLKESVKELRSLPDSVKDEDLTWAKERSKFNQSLSIDSRQNRILTFAHHFAFTGKLPESTRDISNEELRGMLKESIQGSKPVLVSKGNYKKMPYYNELF